MATGIGYQATGARVQGSDMSPARNLPALEAPLPNFPSCVAGTHGRSATTGPRRCLGRTLQLQLQKQPGDSFSGLFLGVLVLLDVGKAS